MIIAIQNDEIGEMLKSTVTLQLLFHVYWQLVCWAEKWIPNSGEWTVVLKQISDIQRDIDIGIELSLAHVIILHVLRGRQNQCFGNCMGFAKLSNSMSNYIRCSRHCLEIVLCLDMVVRCCWRPSRLCLKKSTGFSFWLLRIRNLYSVCEVNKALISTLCSCVWLWTTCTWIMDKAVLGNDS